MDLKDIKFRAKRKDTLDWVYGIPAPFQFHKGTIRTNRS